MRKIIITTALTLTALGLCGCTPAQAARYVHASSVEELPPTPIPPTPAQTFCARGQRPIGYHQDGSIDCVKA